MTATIENLRETFTMLLGCCLHEPVWTPDDVQEILIGVQTDYAGWGIVKGPYIKDVGNESESYTVVRLNDGQMGLLEEGEDYTGHGCQCGSFTGKYASIDELLDLGVTEEPVRELIRKELSGE